jgi:hypothetical protein
MACSGTFTFFENTDMVIKLRNLKDIVTDTLLTGATVSMRVLDSNDAIVTGTTDPIVFVEQATKGLYHGAIPDTAEYVFEDTGTVLITADAGAGLHREWTYEWVCARKD